MMRYPLLAAAVALALAAPAAAQQQQVRPPIAVYWMSAATTSGMGGGAGGMSAADAMRMAMGGGSSVTRSLDLRLGSSQAASDTPRGLHEIPPGLAMGGALPLLSPQPTASEPREQGDRPQEMQQPKGRMLIFWGCSEKAGPGQPVIVDFAKLASGQRVPALAARSVARPQGPAAGRSRSYGEWPNREDAKPVPAQASLRGDHAVKANYAPEIRFAVGDFHDFLAPVQLSASAAGEAKRLAWPTVPNATGYFMAAFGSKQGSEDVVMWTSSEVQESGSALLDYIPPTEVARLIREKVVLAPERSDCAISAEAAKAMDMPMVQFIAYGDELNLVHPPRPTDPKVTWVQQWAVKLRLKSYAMLPLMDERTSPSRRSSEPAARPGSETPGQAAEKPATPPREAQTPAEKGVQEGVRILRGIFGR